MNQMMKITSAKSFEFTDLVNKHRKVNTKSKFHCVRQRRSFIIDDGQVISVTQEHFKEFQIISHKLMQMELERNTN